MPTDPTTSGETMPLYDLPIDGSVEVLHRRTGGEDYWLPWTPSHFLYRSAAAIAVVVVTRPTPPSGRQP